MTGATLSLKIHARLALLILVASASPAVAQNPTCRDLVDGIVRQATSDVLSDAAKARPSMKELGSEQLARLAGKQFLGADRADFKAYGYMMLLWYGGKEGRDIAASHSASLSTEEDRAHFYFVLGLFQLRSANIKTANTGRDYIRQVRASGKVTFVKDEMWNELETGCRLPS
ncbi:hypothetical protein [Pseudorhodoplanes sp.]|uniref:hypothetical protein n=1 Tax=Pseudorhodoplanes sp. TaxID=1934341 RepID=UPI003D0B86E8